MSDAAPQPRRDDPAPTGTTVGATAYLAPEDHLDTLLEELARAGARVRRVHGRLVLADGATRPIAWAQNTWFDPVEIPIASIKSGAQALRAIQRNWAPYVASQGGVVAQGGRAKLIQENLPHVSAKPLVFPAPAPTAPLGSWTLLDATTILAASRCSSPFPNGEVRFVEDRETPPNRAYLKLWEAFTVMGRHPGPGDSCLDLGASPGGWTWVLQSLGATVTAVDKAPLEPRIARLPGVSERRESAFGLSPGDVGPVDWLCCDVICYPTRLLAMVRRWMEAGSVRNFVCTLKFQAATDHESAEAFAAIPGSRLVHLSQNKHELTWMWPG